MKNHNSHNNNSDLSKNAVMYTRVATCQQSSPIGSLYHQKKCIEEYAMKNNYIIVKSFGEHCASGKETNPEIRNMLKYIMQNKTNYILVYCFDRISRPGPDTIYLELRKKGVKIISVTQPIDTDTPTGAFQQNLHFLFSQYDNDLHRHRTILGITEKLKRGYWIGKAPIGYDMISENGEQQIIVNHDGKIIRKGFYMKAIGEWTNRQIAEQMSVWGLKITTKRLKKIFKNPFYCGMIVHSFLKGEVVQGKHEKLIPQVVFDQINNISVVY